MHRASTALIAVCLAMFAEGGASAQEANSKPVSLASALEKGDINASFAAMEALNDDGQIFSCDK